MATKLPVPPLSELESRRRARNVALAVLFGARSESDPDLLAALAGDDDFPDPPPELPALDGPPPDPCRPPTLALLGALADVPAAPPHEHDALSDEERELVRALLEHERRELLPSRRSAAGEPPAAPSRPAH
jgi:hypothetical protein